MKFNGIHGIRKGHFEELMDRYASYNRLPNEVRKELKKVIRQGRFDEFVREQKYKPNAHVERILAKAKEEIEGESEGLGGCIKKVYCGDWHVGITADGKIKTNIKLNNEDWAEIEKVWIGLNSVVGMKKDKSLIQIGSEPTLCNYKDVKNVVTRSYLDDKQWAVQLNDGTWILNGERKDYKKVWLDDAGKILKE